MEAARGGLGVNACSTPVVHKQLADFNFLTDTEVLHTESEASEAC